MKKSIMISVSKVLFILFIALSMASVAQASRKMKIDGVININTASIEQLRLLPRVGPKIAHRIIRFRQKNKFRKISDIMKVKGIGRKTFAKMKKNITTSQPTKFRLLK